MGLSQHWKSAKMHLILCFCSSVKNLHFLSLLQILSEAQGDCFAATVE